MLYYYYISFIILNNLLYAYILCLYIQYIHVGASREEKLVIRTKHTMRVYRAVQSPKYPTSDADMYKCIYNSLIYSDNGGNYGSYNTIYQMFAIYCDKTRPNILSQLKIPTLILHGEEDVLIQVTQAYKLNELIQNSKLITYPGMGHDFPDELVPTMIHDITHFLSLL